MSGFRRGMITNATAADPTLKVPLTFTAAESGATIQCFYDYGDGINNHIQMYYRMGTSGEWLPYTSDQTVTLQNTGDSCQFWNRSENLTVDNAYNAMFTVDSGPCSVSGNIQSLLNWREDCPDDCFYGLFSFSMVEDAAALILPANVVGHRSYYGMFWGCELLLCAPAELPATQLGEYCYALMLSECYSLKAVPEKLPATELAVGCYMYMFAYSGSGLYSPSIEICATTLATESCTYMFDSCTISEIKVHFSAWPVDATSFWVNGMDTSSSNVFYKPSALPEEYGADRIPEGWTVVNID